MSDSPNSSGRVEDRPPTHLVTPGATTKSAGESLRQLQLHTPRPKGRHYLTAKRATAIGSKLNTRQWAVTRDVGRLGIVSGDQIQRLHYGTSAASGRLRRTHLAQLVRWGVLDRLGRSVGGVRAGSTGWVYALGLAGQRLLWPERLRYYARWTPRPSYLTHALAVSELYVSLRATEANSEMDLLSYDTEPRCWRRYFGPGGARSTLKPDSLAVVARDDTEYRFFCEIDCGTEHRPHVVNKAKAYVRYYNSGREQAETGIFPYVLWIAPNPDRVAFLVDALSALPPEYWQLFLVTTAETAARHMADGFATATTNRKEVT